MEEKAEYKVNDKRFKESEVVDMVPADTSINAVVMMAMEKGYTPEFIEKMLNLQERFEKNEARKAFYRAFAEFKAEAPPVTKDKFNKHFQTWYTSLENLLNTYGPYLGKNGLSVTFPTKLQDISEKTMSAVCRLSHSMGHYEDYPMTVPIDKAAVGKQSGQKSRNDIQDIKSTFTYLRSMTAEAALGVAGTEATVDDDGNSAGVSPTKYDEWSAKLSEIQDSPLEDIEKWWPKYGNDVKKDCTKAEAAKIYSRYVEMKKALKEPKEREPGSDDNL